MRIIAGTAHSMPAGLLFDIARYRHRVFVEHLGWQLHTAGRLELDEFDHRDTCYIAAIDAGGAVIGTARLLPTDRPYLLADVFPQLMGDAPLPRSATVWEISRFSAIDPRSPMASPTSNFASPLALDILAAAMRMASDAGAQRLISVSPLGIERILRHAGVKAERASAPREVDGHLLFACWISVDRQWRSLPDIGRPVSGKDYAETSPHQLECSAPGLP
ncbi:acyl-homoserine-lactone synthase [Variovorax sp. N23]|uniref:acyl-homoserine-lactone synthase n=1 Tax=Variovorax sp. N23 TaxID=2980555 RepID=UPI0021CA7537|nr:acyl-homoserine-lactone synthase [Variovorax sp. N23]MCU4119008.1 GNAT family N-acetyltransferase [Variovorax sp. N23]